MPWSPAARLSSAAPTSISSRCTRIIALASGDRREDRDLVAFPQRMFTPDIVLIDRYPDDRKVPQRFGVPAAPRPKPVKQAGHVANPGRQFHHFLGATNARAQPGEIEKLHPNTSENGKKSTVAPGAKSLAISSR